MTGVGFGGVAVEKYRNEARRFTPPPSRGRIEVGVLDTVNSHPHPVLPPSRGKE
jgi:hypothetical protein